MTEREYLTKETKQNLEEYLKENPIPEMNEADSIDFLIKRMEEKEKAREATSRSNANARKTEGNP